MEQDCEVDLTCIELACEMPGEHLYQVQLDIGVALAHGVYQRQSQHGSGAGRQTHSHKSAHSSPVCCHDRIVSLAQTQLGMMQKRQARGGWGDPSRGAIDQPA
ncbi:hypothetical protein D3C81_2047730 [compost metagenome]